MATQKSTTTQPSTNRGSSQKAQQKPLMGEKGFDWLGWDRETDEGARRMQDKSWFKELQAKMRNQ